MLRTIFLILAVLACFALTACETDRYKAGYAKGKKEGYESGKAAATRQIAANDYSNGYERGKAAGYRKGFAAARPGSDHANATGGLLGLGTILGLLHVIVYLVYIKYRLVAESDEARKTWGKLLAGVIAGLVLLWISANFSAVFGFHMSDVYLSPAPRSLVWKFLLGIASAAATYYLFQITTCLPLWYRNHTAWQALLVFVLTLANAAFIKTMLHLLIVPDMSRYLACDLLFGSLIGAVGFVMAQLIAKDDGRMPFSGVNSTNLWSDLHNAFKGD